MNIDLSKMFNLNKCFCTLTIQSLEIVLKKTVFMLSIDIASSATCNIVQVVVCIKFFSLGSFCV